MSDDQIPALPGRKSGRQMPGVGPWGGGGGGGLLKLRFDWYIACKWIRIFNPINGQKSLNINRLKAVSRIVKENLTFSYSISVYVTVFCFHFSALSKGCSFKWVLGLFKWIFTTDSSTQLIIQVHGESVTYSSTLSLDSSYQRLLLPSWSTSSTSCKY